MKRRTLLATGGFAAAVPLAGYLRSEDDPDRAKDRPATETEPATERTYEQCSRVAIAYERFPVPIRDEVDDALSEGAYEAERVLLAEVIDPGRSYVVVDETPYTPTVERSGETQTLALQAVEAMRTPEPRQLSIRNIDERTHELHIELTGEKTLVDETVTVEPGDRKKLDATDRFGNYELTVTVRTDSREPHTDSFRVSESFLGGHLTVSADGVSVGQTVADFAPCFWNDRDS
ncbi:hypothetical protein OB905_00125 [Halobacteria archaeon AArc-dxtr1]|nr:hypothetical protein [Halobacteria archaeon AArc-dxtr1]